MSRSIITRRVGWFFLLVFGLILLFDFSKKGVYDGDLGINLVVVGESRVGVLVIRPREELYSWIVLPEDIKVKVFNLSAEYPLRSLWKFGLGEKNQYEVMEKTLGMEMGLFLSKTVKLEGELELEKLPTALVSLKTKTDLSLKDRWLLRNSINEILGSKQVIEQSFPLSAFDEVIEPDGVSYRKFNRIANVWIKDKFYVDEIFHLGMGVEVNNMSEVAGLASVMATQLDSAGFRVLSVGNEVNEKISNGGCFYILKDRNDLIHKYMKTQVGCMDLGESLSYLNDSSLVGLKIWIK